MDSFKDLAALPDQARVRLRDIKRGLLLNPQDVGVGLSQVVPVLVSLLSPISPLVLLEQPELHLHPRQQAALGDAIIHGMTATTDRRLIIETHGEHLILRLLRRIREGSEVQMPSGASLSAEDVSVAYVQSVENAARVTTIPISRDGEFAAPWPNGFFAERLEELL